MSKHYPLTDIDVSSVETYPTDAQIVFDFEPDEIFLWHSGTAGVILYSFDGKTDHGRMTLGEPTESMIESCEDLQIWLRRETAGSGTATAQVTASQK